MWMMAQCPIHSIKGVDVLLSGAISIVKKIIGVIKAKRHIKREPFRESISSGNKISIKNCENVTLEVSLDVYEVYKSGTIDKDLDKLTSPLVEGHIDSAEIEAQSIDGEVLRERITVNDRPYFETGDLAITSTKETWLYARLNSLTKSTNSGWLHLTDGTRVFYKYVGDDKQQFHKIFGTYDGLVYVQCTAKMDENLKVVSLDVFKMERTQKDLF